MSQIITSSLVLRVGPQTGADGSGLTPRAGKEGELINSMLRGKHAEACYRQQIFAVCTAVAGQAQLLTNTAATMLDISNPLTSGVRLELLKVAVGYVSGTLAAGDILHGLSHVQSSTVPTGGTAITPVCCSAGKTGSALWTAGNGRSLTATPTVLWPIASSFVELATTANGMQQITEDVDGLISIEPGGSYCMIGVAGAGGSSPVLHLAALVRQTSQL